MQNLIRVRVADTAEQSRIGQRTLQRVVLRAQPIGERRRVCSEQGRRALESYFDCLEAIREGREPNVPTEAGEEGMAQSRNGYRIWKYYRK